MEFILRDLIDKICKIYVDDILIYSLTLDEHKRDIITVIERLNKYKLKIKLKKCEFFKTSLQFLGHTIEDGIIKPSNEKMNAIMRVQSTAES